MPGSRACLHACPLAFHRGFSAHKIRRARSAQEKTTHTLQQILSDEYALKASSIERIERGYTNESYAVGSGDSRFVLRRSWPGKAVEQAHREERVLRWLEQHADGLPVPRLVTTRRGEQHICVEARTLHLFVHRDGESPYTWKQACSSRHFEIIMQTLAELHEALRQLPVQDAATPLAAFAQDLALVEQAGAVANFSARSMALQLVQDTLEDFVERGRAILARAQTLPAFQSPLFWCHSDFQLENLLFRGEALTGLLDFDRVRALPLEMDLAFALFSLTRDGNLDSDFEFDRDRWLLGLQLYNTASDQALASSPDTWRDLFCLDQALLHLHAGRTNIWCLDTGIGFVPAYRGVLKS